MDDAAIIDLLRSRISLLESFLYYLNHQKTDSLNIGDISFIEEIMKMLSTFRRSLKDFFSHPKEAVYYISSPDISNICNIVDEISPFIQNNSSFLKIDNEAPQGWSELKNALSKAWGFSLVTVSVEGDDISELSVDLLEYIKIGSKIKDTAEMKNIKKTLQEGLIYNVNEPSIYMAIIGPSYMGKTQSAHSLAYIMDNVFYVNFLNPSELSNTQQVYVPFKRISKVFADCLHDDHKNMDMSESKMTSKSIRDDEKSRLKTLGFLLYLLSLPVIDSVPDRILRYINVNNVTIRPLTVKEFREGAKDLEAKRPNFKLNNSVVFIDELVQTEKVRVLRNICRAVNLPVILSGTTAKVQNLICLQDAGISRTGPPAPWVQVVTTLPKANIASLAELIRFEHLSADSDQSLAMYLNNSRTNINYQALKGNLLSERDLSIIDWTYLESLLKLAVRQSKTNLPGLALVSLKCLIEQIVLLRGSEESLDKLKFWTSLLSKIQREVLERKPKIDSDEGHISSAHILTFPSPIKKNHEVGALAGEKVNNHLFFFGLPNDTKIFKLSASRSGNEKVKFARNNPSIEWEDHCFFPLFKNDFFVHMISWNSWYSITRVGTVASLYQKYKNAKNGMNVSSDANVTDGFQLELLSHWAACYASHVNFNGQATGLDFTAEFMKNLQVLPEQFSFDIIDFPSTLSAFLMKVSVPYLIGPDSFDKRFNSSISQFINIGMSYRPVNKVGWDVIFDSSFDGAPAKSFIECKLWTRSVDISLIFKYYERACDLGCPVSFLVVKSFQGSLNKKFDDLTKQEIQEEIQARLQKEQEERAKNAALIKDDEILKVAANVDKVNFTEDISIKVSPAPAPAPEPELSSDNKKVKLDKKEPASIEDFKKLFDESGKRINIYTAKMQSIESSQSNYFTFQALKEFENPTGVFIILQTTFNPVFRSSYS
jgi:hypothetical protein